MLIKQQHIHVCVCTHSAVPAAAVCGKQECTCVPEEELKLKLVNQTELQQISVHILYLHTDSTSWSFSHLLLY